MALNTFIPTSGSTHLTFRNNYNTNISEIESRISGIEVLSGNLSQYSLTGHQHVVDDVSGLGTMATESSGDYSPTGHTHSEYAATSHTHTVTDINSAVAPYGYVITADGSGNATIIGDDINNGSTDACGIASLSVSPNSFDIGDLGDNLVTLTVTDVNGNSTTCTAIVTVTEFLSTESVLTTENVKIYPNPTEESLIISFSTS